MQVSINHYVLEDLEPGVTDSLFGKCPTKWTDLARQHGRLCQLPKRFATSTTEGPKLCLRQKFVLSLKRRF
jgi:hypothetical protein